MRKLHDIRGSSSKANKTAAATSMNETALANTSRSYSAHGDPNSSMKASSSTALTNKRQLVSPEEMSSTIHDQTRQSSQQQQFTPSLASLRLTGPLGIGHLGYSGVAPPLTSTSALFHPLRHFMWFCCLASVHFCSLRSIVDILYRATP